MSPALGVVGHFPPGDYARAESALEALRQSGIRHLRTAIFWSELESPDGHAWYEWLLARIAAQAELLPCLSCAPPGLAEPLHDAGDPERYGRFVADVLDHFGAHFQWVELWATPRHGEWDWHLDPERSGFTSAIAQAVAQARGMGKRVVLGAAAPGHAGWLELLGARAVLDQVNAIGLQGFPPATDPEAFWTRRIARLRDTLSRHRSPAEVWITETGHGDDLDLLSQFQSFDTASAAPVQRVYWHALQDLPERPGSGLYDLRGEPRLLARTLARDRQAVAELSRLSTRPPRADDKPVALITGGAGFIGTNLAERLLAAGQPVRILDNLSRPGTEHNLRGLMERHGERLEFRLGDLRHAPTARAAVNGVGQVYHLAAQVAVTTSLIDPIHDFENNGRSTLNLLEALRAQPEPPPLLFTSTNKVYGALEDIALEAQAERYRPSDAAVAAAGIDEGRPLAFCSPYGCSKGASDQYVLDYARSFGLPTVVFRMSCIYGPHQHGTEDQGWVAHFARQALAEAPITLYGDGRQVRDVLYAEDLVEAMLAAQTHMDRLRGQAFNIGGGPGNTVSLKELVALLTELLGRSPALNWADWRPGDQRYYVSDVSRFSAATGWMPRTDLRSGLAGMLGWLNTGLPAAAAHPGRAAL